MDQERLNDHYKKLASNYEQSFRTKLDNQGSYSFMGEDGALKIIEMMNITKNDKLVDLGAGTCITAGNKMINIHHINIVLITTGQISRLAGLSQPVLCVEPVQEMLDVAIKNKVENVETLCATAEEFVMRDINYDKLLIKGTVHHFPRKNLRMIFQGIYTQLTPNGIVLIDKVSSNQVASLNYFK